LFFSFRSFVSSSKEKKYTLAEYMYSYFYEQFSVQNRFHCSLRFYCLLVNYHQVLQHSLPSHCHSRSKAGASMDFLPVKIAQLVCRTTGKLINVYRLQTSKSLRMVRLTLLTAANRYTMPASAIQDHLDAWIISYCKRINAVLLILFFFKRICEKKN
jgi:hypothetical protein